MDKAVCYYQIYVSNGVLDTHANKYRWIVKVQHLVSVVAIVAFGKDLEQAEKVETVGGQNQFF